MLKGAIMKKNVVLNKYYRNLRKNVFNDIDMNEFIEIWLKFKRLKIQYRLLKIAEKLENIEIKVIEIPIFRFFSKFVDFMRWKIYDLLMLIINGRKFELYGLTVFCGRQRWRKNYINGRIS